MPAMPKTAQKAAANVEYVTWDEFVDEATRHVTPYQILLPGDDEPTTIPCPTGLQMEALAPRILELTADKPFTVRASLFAKVMAHYGMQMRDLPES
jgi:hypothetical protein